jgi:hypothetical protein
MIARYKCHQTCGTDGVCILETRPLIDLQFVKLAS